MNFFLTKGRNVYYFFIIFFGFANVASTTFTNKLEHPLADHLLTKIKEDNWREDETSCYNDITRLLESARNHTLWATWVLDSMQQPVGSLYGSRYHLGNFDQCLDQRWSSSNPKLKTQYCLVDVTSQERKVQDFDAYGDAETLAGSTSKYGERLFLNSIGVCVPASCSLQAVKKISFHIIRSTHLPYGDVSVDPRNCQGVTKEIEYSFSFYIFWFIIISSLALTATVYLFEDYITDPKLSEISSWFSISKNLEALVNTRPKDVKVLHGIRIFCNMATIIIHYIHIVTSLAVVNHTNVGKDMETFWWLSHPDVNIGSFFLLSGFLLMKGLCKSKTLEPFKVLSKRYKRLLAPYAMVILYVVSVSPYMGSGPLWPRFLKKERDPCVRNWWPGALMMHNVINTDDLCYFPQWYLSCDFQLTILGLIIFWYWKKDQKKWLAMYSAALILSIGVCSFLTYWYTLPLMLAFNIDSALDMSQNQVYHRVYSKSYSNANSYLIGFATGYIMSAYKPEHNRKKISKTTSIAISVVLCCMVLSMFNAIGSLLFKDYGSLSHAMYSGLNDVIWSGSLCGLIMICEYGTLPIITNILEHRMFIPLSRLTYGAYLIHISVINRNIYSLRAPLSYDLFNMSVNGLGYVAVSFMLSYIQWFIIEAPASNMFNCFQKNRSKNHKTEN